MKEREFEYGPLSRGLFIALVCVTALVPLLKPAIFFYYVGFLLFLAFGLRPLLVFSGLHGMWLSTEHRIVEKWDRKYLAKRRLEIERKQRDEKVRKSRVRSSKLPRNW